MQGVQDGRRPTPRLRWRRWSASHWPAFAITASGTGEFFRLAPSRRRVSRGFTADDVRLVQFIRDRTGAKQPQQHDQIVQALRAGELADYHPAADEAAVDEDAESMSRDILLAPQIAALQIVLKDYSLREAALQQRIDQTAQAAAERERALQAEIASLQRELGQVEGELSTIKSRRPWWQFWRQAAHSPGVCLKFSGAFNSRTVAGAMRKHVSFDQKCAVSAL